MKAFVYETYGPPEVLHLKEIEKPEPAENEIRVKIHSTTVTAGDCEIREFNFPLLFWIPLRIMFGIFKPKRKILGQEFSGVIDQIGREVKKVKVGDEIFAPSDMNFGTYTEYKILKEDHTIGIKPKTLSFAEAAAVSTGGLNAIYFLKKVNISAGEKILIIGAGGSIGTSSVQLAKYYGAEVTAVDCGAKLEMLENIGADHVIDYQQEDFACSRKKYDVIFDIADESDYFNCMASLNKGGRYLLATPKISKIFAGMFSNKKVVTGVAAYTKKDMIYLQKLVQDGVIKPHIDKQFKLESIVEAHQYVETGMKQGNVAVLVSQ